MTSCDRCEKNGEALYEETWCTPPRLLCKECRAYKLRSQGIRVGQLWLDTRTDEVWKVTYASKDEQGAELQLWDGGGPKPDQSISAEELRADFELQPPRVPPAAPEPEYTGRIEDGQLWRTGDGEWWRVVDTDYTNELVKLRGQDGTSPRGAGWEVSFEELHRDFEPVPRPDKRRRYKLVCLDCGADVRVLFEGADQLLYECECKEAS